MPTCDRCKDSTNVTRMSMFNRDILCPSCIDLERKHPDFAKAHDADRAEMKMGNFNFEGIGKPADL